jgi:hypothetical protein
MIMLKIVLTQNSDIKVYSEARIVRVYVYDIEILHPGRCILGHCRILVSTTN